MANLYTVKRYLYKTKQDIEANKVQKVICLGFNPMSLREAHIVKGKINNNHVYAGSYGYINKIVGVV